MKPKYALRHFLALAGSALLAMPMASAATYYWDSNNDTSLYGTAQGTWSGTTAGTLTGGWSTSNTGVTAVDGNSVTTATGDTINFGNATASSLLTGVITVSGTVNSGNMTFGAGAGNITLSGGTINFAAASTITTNNSTTLTNTISSAISGAGTSLTKAGSGILVLSGASTYTGFTSVTAGTLAFSGDANVASANALGQSTADAANLRLSNGTTLRYVGSGGSTDRGFTLNSTGGNQGATLNASGTGAINFTNTASPAYGTIDQNRVLTLTGTNTGNNTLGAGLTDNGIGLTSINKTGLGTWVLNGNNTYTGATTIQGGGTLILDYGTGNGNNSKLGATAVTFQSGAGNLTLRGGSHVETIGSFNLGTGGGHATIAREVGSTATIALGIITRSQSNGVTLSITEDNIATTTSTAFRGMLGGGITVGSNWAKVDGSGNIIALTSGDYTNLTGAVDATTVNYQLTGGLTPSPAGSVKVNSLRIEGTGLTDQSLDMGSNVLHTLNVSSVTAASPNNHTFGNSGGILYAGGGTNNYTITGAGNIAVNNNSQELIINTYTGTLTVDMVVATGSATSALTKTGAGTLILTKANTYSGGTNVNQGVLRLRDSAAAGTTGLINVHNGAALELANGVAIAAPLVANKVLTITGTGVSSGGALRNVASNTSSYAGVINIGTGGARINSDASGSLTLTGGVVTAFDKDVTFGGAGNTTVSTTAISGAGNLIKDGAGTTTLGAANTYTGTTTISGGILRYTGNSSAANGAVSVTAGALGGNGGSLGGAVRVSATGGINLADGTVGNLALSSTLGSTGISGANNFIFDLANAGSTVDQIVTTGAFSMTNSGAVVVNLNQLGGSANRLTAGTYDLMTAASGLTAGGSQFQLATTKAFGQTFSLSGTTTTALKLTTTQVTGAVATDTTLNVASGSWQTGSNFTGTAVPDYQSNVIIDSAIGATPLDGSTNINSLTFASTATTAVTVSGGAASAGTSASMLVIEAGAVNGNTAGNGITLSNTSGTHTISANVGLAANQTWTTATGGTLSVSGAISDFGGGFSLTKDGLGSLTLSGTNTYTGATTVNGGTLQLGNGGTTGSLSNNSAISVASGATFVVNRSNTVTQGTDFRSSPITGAGGFTQAGSGTTVLTGINTYTGATTVTGGALIINGNISTSSLTTVQTGATLGGSGSVGALTVQANGTIAPGNSPDGIDVIGAYTQAGTYQAEITANTPGKGTTGYDQVNVTGTVDITGGSLTTLFSGAGYAANDLLFLLLNDGADAITGTYSGFAQGAVAATYGGFDWQISYTGNSTGSTFTGGNDVALMAVAAIPEPRAALLGSLGLLMLLRRRRR